MSMRQIGTASEYRFFAFILSQGWSLYIPANPEDLADCVIDRGQGLESVQIKSCRWAKDNHYRARLTSGTSRPYGPDSFNLLGIVGQEEGEIWLAPWSEFFGKAYFSGLENDQWRVR